MVPFGVVRHRGIIIGHVSMHGVLLFIFRRIMTASCFQKTGLGFKRDLELRGGFFRYV